MKTFLLCASCLLLYGCTRSHLKTPQGGDYSTCSFLWQRDAANIHIDTNGVIDITVLGSKSDSDALKAVAAGAAEGTVKGMAAAVKP